MTIEGYSYDGWPIHPNYRPNLAAEPAPLRRSERLIDLPTALEIGRQHRTRNIFKRIMEHISG